MQCAVIRQGFSNLQIYTILKLVGLAAIKVCRFSNLQIYTILKLCRYLS